jgi:hypothetical protein
MNEERKPREIVPVQETIAQMQQFESSLLEAIGKLKLPTESILVPVQERAVIFNNVESVVLRVDESLRPHSVYLSKFIAACASGLFDAALNYLWDETILQLRRRISQYDLSYFYDNAVSGDKRSKFNTEEDLTRLSDAETIEGAKRIELVSDIGYRHLDYIRFMRNWVSAAHPNQNELTGLQLIGWLETCIKEVMSLPLSAITVEIGKFLSNIRATVLTAEDANRTAVFFVNLSQEQVNNLTSGLYSIFTRADTSQQIRGNVELIVPYLWERVDEPTRNRFGIQYGRFVANNDRPEADLAKYFLDRLNASSYIPETLRAAEIDSVLDNLLNAHRGSDNFYSEPPFAKALQDKIGDKGTVPETIEDKYTNAVVDVFLSNGNGVCWDADVIYKKLISFFNLRQSITAVLSFYTDTISNKLWSSLCKEKYLELLSMLETRVTAPVVEYLIRDIKSFTGPFHEMHRDTNLLRQAEIVRRMPV